MGEPAAGLTAIGRYRLERVLGRGAMGTVYAAYDPDLDRLVAIKVLHAGQAAERLLREARAMARLKHPNVVTVHEVGTEAGIDFVVMELVDGGTLKDWLRDANPSESARLAAMLDAGRGLAAAHAAGLVHRDFKPHNVMRDVSGRVLVGDFGLARGDGRSSNPEIIEPVDAPVDDQGATIRTPSQPTIDLGTSLTVSGALVGTPAYMAPEQYHQTSVDPAADQFAFCVSLWEALAGRRPFGGPTLLEQRASIDRGPDPASEAKLPRRLRPILRRGLAIDPVARWPSMDALLVALQPRSRRPWLALAALPVVALVAVLLARGHGSSCDTALPYRTSASRTALLAKPNGAGVIDPLDDLADDWQTVRGEACQADASIATTRELACLDVVRDELALATDVSARVAMDLRDLDAASTVGDPFACRTGPARVAVARDPRALAVADFNAEELASYAWPPEQTADPPCVRASWLMGRAMQASFTGDRGDTIRGAADVAEKCGDDRLRALVLVDAAELETGNPFGLRGAIHRAELAVQRAGSDRMLAARIQLLHAIELDTEDDLDAAVPLAVAATDALVAMHAYTAVVIATITTDAILSGRGTPADDLTSERLLRAAIPHTGPRSQFYLAHRLAMVLWQQGRVDDAYAAAAAIDPGPVPDSVTVRGRVVDADGKPVAHARVVASAQFVGDGRSSVIAPDRHTDTSVDGTFKLTGVGKTAYVAAELGDRRSTPVPVATALELRLGPTRTITGLVHADIGVSIAAAPTDDGWSVLGRVAPDGSFRIDGVPDGPVSVVATARGRLSASHVVDGSAIELSIPRASASLTVVVRSEVEGRIAAATVYAIRGRVDPHTLGELSLLPNAMSRQWARPAPADLRLDPDDLVAIAKNLAPGEITACACATGDPDDAAYAARLSRHKKDLEVRCTTTTLVEPSGSVIVTVPAPKRLPE